MICFYFHPTPNPTKVALLLEEAGLPYEVVPVDTSKGGTFGVRGRRNFAIGIDGAEGGGVLLGGREARVFDSTAILLYLAEKTAEFLGKPEERPELLSWLMFIAMGLGPFSGQAVHFQHAAPTGLDYAVNRYRREAERNYNVLNDHLVGRQFIVGDSFTIVDISAWGWLGRASRVLKGAEDPFAAYPEIKRWFAAIEARPSRRARESGRERSRFQDDRRRGNETRAVPVQLSLGSLRSRR
jgi:GSH-dependent disulfide-bond oxidoreductase